jgi:hypothetical protein
MMKRKSQLIKKPLNPSSCSSAVRRFISTSLVQRSTLVVAVSPTGPPHPEQTCVLFRQYPFVMRKRFTLGFVQSAQGIYNVVPFDDSPRSIHA